jgi:hypothetical protein
VKETNVLLTFNVQRDHVLISEMCRQVA